MKQPVADTATEAPLKPAMPPGQHDEEDNLPLSLLNLFHHSAAQ